MKYLVLLQRFWFNWPGMGYIRITWGGISSNWWRGKWESMYPERSWVDGNIQEVRGETEGNSRDFKGWRTWLLVILSSVSLLRFLHKRHPLSFFFFFLNESYTFRINERKQSRNRKLFSKGWLKLRISTR